MLHFYGNTYMDIAIPQRDELVKEGMVSPSGIQFLDNMRLILQDSAMTAEQRDFLVTLTAQMVAGADVAQLTNTFLDDDGPGRALWLAAVADVAGGGGTVAELNTYMSWIMVNQQQIYDKSKEIITRLEAVETALEASNILEAG